LHAADAWVHHGIHAGKQEVSRVWLLRGAFVPQLETIGTQDARKRGADHDGDGAFFHESFKHFTAHG
jgi:hypothetical protein